MTSLKANPLALHMLNVYVSEYWYINPSDLNKLRPFEPLKENSMPDFFHLRDLIVWSPKLETINNR